MSFGRRFPFSPHGPVRRRPAEPRLARALRAGAVLLLLTGTPALSAAQEEEFFPVSGYDIVVTKDHMVLVGRILQTDDPSKVVIRLHPSGVVQTLDRTEVKEIKPRATPEEAVERKFVELPDQIPYIARRALRAFPGNRAVEAMVLKWLEKTAASGDSGALPLLAERYMAAGDAAAAEKAARALLARQDCAIGHCLLGEALAAQGREKEADESLARALKMAPEDETIMVKWADFLLEARRPEEARKIFTDALARNPNLVAAHCGLGYVCLRQGEMEAAVAGFDHALALDLQHLKSKLGLAAAKALLKDYGETYRLAKEVLMSDPKSAQAYGLQAYARLMQGGPDEKQALTRVDHALEEDPGEPRLKILKAVALDRSGQFLEVTGKAAEARGAREEAARLLAEAGDSQARDAWVHYLIAEMRCRQEEYEPALEGFRRAAELAPSYAAAYQGVGASALAIKKWSDSEQAYRRALALDPANVEAQAGLGLALLGQGRIPEAQASLKEAYKAAPNNVPALCGLGYIANLEKNEKSVHDLFHQALAVDGECQYAANALKELYAFRGLHLEYLNFSDSVPATWTAKGIGPLKPVVSGGKVVWSGTQGMTPSVKLEFCTSLKAQDFVRFEADLDIAADSPAALALRIGSGVGAAVSFEFEFGKDDANHLAYRIRDYSGARPWTVIPEPWPPSGKIRLAIETPELLSGRLELFANGTPKGHLELKLQRLGRIVAGVFLQAPAKAAVNASADNFVLVSRATVGGEEEATGPGELVPPDKKDGEPGKAVPPEKKEPGAGQPAPAEDKKEAAPEPKAETPVKKEAGPEPKAAPAGKEAPQ